MPVGAYQVQRTFVGIVALPLTAFSLAMILPQLRSGFEPIGAAFGSCTAVVATLCWWFVLRGHLAESRERMRFAVLCGLVLGGISFALGFIGPMILVPNDNQGPLLGIFVTGPAGFVLGVAVGWLYGRPRRQRGGST